MSILETVSTPKKNQTFLFGCVVISRLRTFYKNWGVYSWKGSVLRTCFFLNDYNLSILSLNGFSTPND